MKKTILIKLAIILACILAIGGVITAAIIGRKTSNDNNPPTDIEQDENDNNETDEPPSTDDDIIEEPIEKVYTLMDLGSTGCAPCDNLQPILANLRVKYDGKIDILFYDVNRTTEGAKLAQQYKLQYIPTLIFLDENGKEAKRVIGYVSQQQIESVFRGLGWI